MKPVPTGKLAADSCVETIKAGVGYSANKHSSQRQNGLFVSSHWCPLHPACSWFSSDGVSIVVPLPSNINASFQQILSSSMFLLSLSLPLVSLFSLPHEGDASPCSESQLFSETQMSHREARCTASACADGFRLLSE